MLIWPLLSGSRQHRASARDRAVLVGSVAYIGSDNYLHRASRQGSTGEGGALLDADKRSSTSWEGDTGQAHADSSCDRNSIVVWKAEPEYLAEGWARRAGLWVVVKAVLGYTVICQVGVKACHPMPQDVRLDCECGVSSRRRIVAILQA